MFWQLQNRESIEHISYYCNKTEDTFVIDSETQQIIKITEAELMLLHLENL